MRTALLVLTGLAIAACSAIPPSSAENQQQPSSGEVLNKRATKDAATNYLCKDDQRIKVVRVVSKNKKIKGKETINLTFRNVTRRLALSISESGKKYTNIHWHWHEKAEFSLLTTSFGDILAEQCVAQ